MESNIKDIIIQSPGGLNQPGLYQAMKCMNFRACTKINQNTNRHQGGYTMKKTIAEARRMELEKLTDNYTHDSAISENLMNRFYRICGALNRLLILENTEMTANTVYTQDLDNKTQKAITCLKTDFEKYGLTLVFYGYLPTITDKPGSNDVIFTFFYN